MEFAEPADGSLSAVDPCASSGVHTTHRLGLELNVMCSASECERFKHVGFNIEEIRGLVAAAPLLGETRTGGNTGQSIDLLQSGTLRCALQDELLAQLK